MVLSEYDQDLFGEEYCVSCFLELRLPKIKTWNNSKPGKEWFQDQPVIKNKYPSTATKGYFQFQLHENDLKGNDFIQIRVKKEFSTISDSLTVKKWLLGSTIIDPFSDESNGIILELFSEDALKN